MAGWGWPLAKWRQTTTAPGVGDDIDDDFQIGSEWIDTVADISYKCVDNTRGAAVWVESGGGSAFSATSRGQFLYSIDGSTFTAQTPVAGDDTGIILTEDDTGYVIVVG